MLLNYFLVIIIACSISLALTPMVRHLALRLGLVDNPGGRKIHIIAVPRLGGVSLCLSMCLSLFVSSHLGTVTGVDISEAWPSPEVLLGMGLAFLVGLYDDLRPTPAWCKFSVQFVAAGIVIYSGVRIPLVSIIGFGSVDPGMLAIPLTFLWIVGITNAFNLIDGLDGLAAGLGFIAAVTSTIIFCLGGGFSADALLLVILAGVLAGFLRYNFHPASIFLGDSGSQVIGYVLAVTSVVGSQKSATALPLIIPVLIFGLPICDTVLSMLRRALRGVPSGQRAPIRLKTLMDFSKRMFEADRDHVHHRLISMGLSHRDAVLTLYCLATALSVLAVSAVIAEYRNVNAILLTVIAAGYLGIRKLGYEEITFMKTGTLLRWCEQTVFLPLRHLMLLDAVASALAYWGAFALKYGEGLDQQILHWYLVAFPFIILIQISVFWPFGLYRGLWRSMGYADLLPLTLAAGGAALISYVLAVVYEPPVGIQAFFSIDGLLLLAFILGGRGANRILLHVHRQNNATGGVQVLIYGAGRRGEWVLHELTENRRLCMRPIGFVDDDPRLLGLMVNRVRVLGTGRDLRTILKSRKVTAVIVSSDKINTDRLASIMTTCGERRIPIFRVQLQFNCLSEIPRPKAQYFPEEEKLLSAH